MFWRMAGISPVAPVEALLDKGSVTLEELLDEHETIQECKALNLRLITFLQERDQVEQLVRYIVEEAPEGADSRRTFKLPFVACEIFTCKVDGILKTLVEDEGLMNMLFSYLVPKHSHNIMLAGYFSKVVICLLSRKTVSFINYVKDHPEILGQLVDLIGITSIMEVLIRLIGGDEHVYTNFADAVKWIQDTDVLEMIVDKFSSSDSPEVHANVAETLCSMTRFGPSGVAAKISCPNFISRLFRHALEESRPKSVLVNSLSICISLLDPKRLTLGTYHTYNRQTSHGSTIITSPQTVEGMLESLGELLKLLHASSSESVLLTTYGKLQPPLGKHRLKIVEFVSVLVIIGSEVAEMELIRLGALQRIFDLFFEYPYNNFLHHHVENIIVSCLESKNACLNANLLRECNLVGKILEAERNFMLAADPSKPTVPAEGRSPPRVGNIGHLTRISNKLLQLANNNSDIQTYLQGNEEWINWQTNVLTKRNVMENVQQWICGRPTSLQDHRDSDDDDYRDRDYDVAALANNLSEAFQYGIYSNDATDQVHSSFGRDDEDVYFDDESAEVVISSLRLGGEQESGSLFTNSNWFAFEDNTVANEDSAGSLVSSSLNNEGTGVGGGVGFDEVIIGKGKEFDDTATSSLVSKPEVDCTSVTDADREISAADKPTAWVEWRETVNSNDPSHSDVLCVSNGELQVDSEAKVSDADGVAVVAEPLSSSNTSITNENGAAGESPNGTKDRSRPDASASLEFNNNAERSSGPIASDDAKMAGETEEIPCANKGDLKDVV